MIKNFKHKGLSRLFIEDDKSGINAQHRERVYRLLDRLDCIAKAEDMNLPGYGFHKLVGNRKDTFSVKASGNWRITL